MLDNLNTISLQDLYGKKEIGQAREFSNSSKFNSGFQTLNIQNDYLNGTHQSAHFKELGIIYQEWDLYQPFKLKVQHSVPMVKIQFEMLGDSYYKGNGDRVIHIPEKHYQFIHIHETDGELTYRKSRKVLDIYLDIAFLINLLNTQGYSDIHFQEHFLASNLTFFRHPTVITHEQEIIINQLIHHPYRSEFAQDFLRCKATELILSVISGASNRVKKDKWNPQDLQILTNIKSFLDDNYQKEIHFNTLTRNFGINEYKLKQVFKDVYGDTVFGYLRKLRLIKAHEMLQQTNLEIKEVAFLTGFKYAHHFSRLFYEQFKVLPKQVKNRMLDQY